MQQNISLSVLNVKETIPQTLLEYKSCVQKLGALCKKDTFSYGVHFDIMDNKFVPNTGVSLEYIKTAKNLGFFVDVHLMVENPIGEKYVQKAIEYGADSITIHYEIQNFESILKYLNERRDILLRKYDRKLEIGICIKPQTNIDEILSYENSFSKLLIMSVEPGFGGQKYITKTFEKIKEAQKKLPNHVIQVDGGINFDTIEDSLKYCVDSIVIGSYLSLSSNLYNKILELEIKKDIERLPKDLNIEFDSKLLQIRQGGYGEGDILRGISTPNIRKTANYWYKYLNLDILDNYISSSYHEYRKFACICLSNLSKYLLYKKNKYNLSFNDEELIKYFENNLPYINNWDLTDEVGTNVLGKYLINKELKEVKGILCRYFSSSSIWVRRIGIVSCLEFAKLGYKEIPFWGCDKLLYDENILVNKAVGCILREVYKKHPNDVFEYIYSNSKLRPIPRFVVLYASEKMSKDEKKKIREKN